MKVYRVNRGEYIALYEMSKYYSNLLSSGDCTPTTLMKHAEVSKLLRTANKVGAEVSGSVLGRIRELKNSWNFSQARAAKPAIAELHGQTSLFAAM